MKTHLSLHFLLLALFLAPNLLPTTYAQSKQPLTVFGIKFSVPIPEKIEGYAVRWSQVRDLTLSTINSQPPATSKSEALGKLSLLVAQQTDLVQKEFARIAVKNNLDVAEVVDIFLQNSGDPIDKNVQYQSNLLAGLSHLYNCLTN
ncbi:MAG: hypothetical protein N2035_07240 [Chthoniobacterales bacterium]|nr:hypothetical protein [Chthoniobacterales bacterium]